MIKILLKVASLLYFSFAGFAFLFGWYIFYVRGAFSRDLIAANIFITGGGGLSMFFAIWLRKLSNKEKLNFLVVIASLVLTSVYGYFTHFNISFWYVSIPCILVIVAYIVQMVMPNNSLQRDVEASVE